MTVLMVVVNRIKLSSLVVVVYVVKMAGSVVGVNVKK